MKPNVMKANKTDKNENELCHACMKEAGYVRKDKGSHTAILTTCKQCGARKAILPSRHYKKYENQIEEV